MINFRQYLIESKSAPLYHATSLENIPSILQKGLKDAEHRGTVHYQGMKSASRQYRTVSAARTLKAALRYGDERFWSSDTCIIVLNQQKITTRFKMIPYDYYQTIKITGIGGSMPTDLADENRRIEAEETIVLPTNKTITKDYFIEVLLPRGDEDNTKILQKQVCELYLQ